MRVNARVFVYAVTFFAVGCKLSPPEGEFGIASNEERKARQIPIIPEHWNGRGGGHEASWGNPAFADPKTTNNPMHARKEIFVDPQRNLHQECDFYYSGKKYPSKSEPDSMDWEKLTINYDYEVARSGQNPWQCLVSCGPHYRNATRSDAESGQVTFEEAEVILKEWGISRLNY